MLIYGQGANMETIGIIFAAMCVIFSSFNHNITKECEKTHTQQECQQMWRDK
jgi:hypothetical protein